MAQGLFELHRLVLRRIMNQTQARGMTSWPRNTRYTMNTDTFIQSNPGILGGTPVFAGTRVPVRILFEYIETGETVAAFLDEFPSVSLELAKGVLQQAKQAVAVAHPA